MTWSDVTREPSRQVVRQFAWLCFLIGAGTGLFQALARSRWELGLGLLLTGSACLAVGLLAPRWLRWVYTGAMVFAFPIGFAVSQVLLAVLFFVVFLAVGLALRLSGVDPMLRRRQPPDGSYWSEKHLPQDPQRYLRQY